VVLETHAVVHPGAVVVKALHTAVADAAVARSLGANHFAVGTQLDWVEVLEQSL